MRPYRASALLASLLASSCTLFGGQPWGFADVELQVAFAPEESRRTDDGWLLTSSDFAYELSDFSVDVAAVRLRISNDAAGGGGAFDPANPPPGYSLCHQGHCHRDDRRDRPIRFRHCR